MPSVFAVTSGHSSLPFLHIPKFLSKNSQLSMCGLFTELKKDEYPPHIIGEVVMYIPSVVIPSPVAVCKKPESTDINRSKEVKPSKTSIFTPILSRRLFSRKNLVELW